MLRLLECTHLRIKCTRVFIV